MKKAKISIVIPARNEEDVIVKTLNLIKETVKVPYNVIIVNDHSTDKTEEVINKYAKKFRNITLVKTKPKKGGFANALARGFEVAKEKFVVVVMADLCDEPQTINIMYKEIQKNWDIICGSRYIKGGGKTGGPFLQGLLSQLVCLSLHLVTGIPSKDVSNAFKMYRRDILKDLKINPKSGVEASMEITLQAYFKGAKIKDVPTHWKGRTIGKSKFKLIERSPRYFRIYSWALQNSLRNIFGLPQKSYKTT